MLIQSIEDCKIYGNASSASTNALLQRAIRKLDTFVYVDTEDEDRIEMSEEPVSETLEKWGKRLAQQSSSSPKRLSVSSRTTSILRPEEPSIRIARSNESVDLNELLMTLWPSFAYYSLSVQPEELLLVTQRTCLIFLQDCQVLCGREADETKSGKMWTETARLMISKIIDDSEKSDREGKSIGFRRFVILLSRITKVLYGIEEPTRRKESKQRRDGGISLWRPKKIQYKQTLDELITHKKEFRDLLNDYVRVDNLSYRMY